MNGSKTEILGHQPLASPAPPLMPSDEPGTNPDPPASSKHDHGDRALENSDLENNGEIGIERFDSEAVLEQEGAVSCVDRAAGLPDSVKVQKFAIFPPSDTESDCVLVEDLSNSMVGRETCGIGDELQKEGSSSESGKNVSDCSLLRAKTMLGESTSGAQAELPEEQTRSKSERRRHCTACGDQNAQIFDPKIPAKKQLKMLARMATVKNDGTVEFEVTENLPHDDVDHGSEAHTGAVDEETDELIDLQDIQPLQIVMLIVGTQGDVQPFVAIGKRLQVYGHRVRLATHSNFEEFVLTAGLEFYPLGGDPKVLAGYMVKNKGFLPSGASEIPIQRKQIKEIINSLLPACREPYGSSGVPFKADAIISNPPAYGHTHVAEALKVPLHIFFTMPWTPTSEFPHPLSRVKQPAGYRLSYQIVDSLIWLGIRDMINDFRKKKLKLRPVTYLSGAQGCTSDIPTGYIWSPHLVPKPKDWGPKVDCVGFCFLDLATNYKPPESLEKFIGDPGDKKPIYIGFGSLPVQEPEKMTQIIVEALEITEQRGIINKGWGGLGNSAEKKEFVYLLDNCPHDWLFLHCAAVVHHGGAGTTAAGLKAACPTTVVPFFGDQPFWGERVHARGVGPPPIPVDQFSCPKLVDAIRFMLDPKVKERAEELARVMASEDGVAGAVKAFHKHLPRNMPQPQPQPQPPTAPPGFFDRCLGNVRKCFGCS
ncbi:sterol 3-beta-glucosyltransferase UGT80A2 isoform X2 [Amborella trichopoda]|uniref:sterol 3-beta-glucosyltransferase UGT80A2 isoform X2 n=1 Tax=Amborella trichopoda TaxID=13333 RepID=UPI0005D41123|nr:sterol 3-beta-glucosyltransferase UGT80A2 isoform X2 [Amborella trichopoda]|eukprot:XP_011627049.1 sterol 3-beta-glucosyltransferase UGT80A2 isoform X2 [Amborella trichopoda]